MVIKKQNEINNNLESQCYMFLSSNTQGNTEGCVTRTKNVYFQDALLQIQILMHQLQPCTFFKSNTET